MAAEKIYIERCPHDEENPYAMINRNLIRDQSLSMGCRWMLIYLLSNDKGWRISSTQIWKHCQQHRGGGRDSVLGWLREACDAGYMKREEYLENGKLRRSRYFLSETPKFKKSLPCPEIQGPIEKGPFEQGHKKEHKSSKEDFKNKHKEEGISSVPSDIQEGGAEAPPPPRVREKKKSYPKKKEEKKPYLENVFLTEDEHKSLINALGSSKTSEMIDDLSWYMKSQQKRYKSHYHTILNWVRRDKKKKEPDDKPSGKGMR